MQSENKFEIFEIFEDKKESDPEEELLKTIKMEPIIETTVIDEEPVVTKKKKIMKVTDYFLLSLIVIISVVFVFVIVKVS